MDTWIPLVQWVAAVVGAVIVIGALGVGAMAWVLNYPD